MRMTQEKNSPIAARTVSPWFRESEDRWGVADRRTDLLRWAALYFPERPCPHHCHCQHHYCHFRPMQNSENSNYARVVKPVVYCYP